MPRCQCSRHKRSERSGTLRVFDIGIVRKGWREGRKHSGSLLDVGIDQQVCSGRSLDPLGRLARQVPARIAAPSCQWGMVRGPSASSCPSSRRVWASASAHVPRADAVRIGESTRQSGRSPPKREVLHFKGPTVVLGPPRHGLEWLGMDPGVRGRGHTVPPRRHRPSGLFPLRPLVAGAKRSHGRRGIQFAIWRYDSRWTLVGTGATSDINTGTAWNTIKVVRDGDDISLYVNGIFQTMISDDAMTDFLRIG